MKILDIENTDNELKRNKEDHDMSEEENKTILQKMRRLN